MELTGYNFIGNVRSAEGPDSIAATNPATGATLEPTYHAATDGEVDRAVVLAEAAFPVYRSLSAEQIGRASCRERV